MVESLTCEEKQRLLGAYQYVTEQYSAALTQLQRKMGVLSKPSYDALYRITEALCHDSMHEKSIRRMFEGTAVRETECTRP
jgi:hypothetical protein